MNFNCWTSHLHSMYTRGLNRISDTTVSTQWSTFDHRLTNTVCYSAGDIKATTDRRHGQRLLHEPYCQIKGTFLRVRRLCALQWQEAELIDDLLHDPRYREQLGTLLTFFDESRKNCDGPLNYKPYVFDTRMIRLVIVTPHRLMRFLLWKINLRWWERYCSKVASPFSGGHIIS